MFERLKNKFKRSATVANAQNTTYGTVSLLDMISSNAQTSTTGIDITPETAVNTSTVYACVNILANNIAKMPLQLYERTPKGRQHVTDLEDKVSYLIEKRPNDFLTPFQFKHLLEVHRNLWGNAYINIEWGVDGKPKSLWILNPALTFPQVRFDTGELFYLTTLPDGTNVKLNSTDVIHLKALATGSLKGIAPISAARENIGSLSASQQFKGKFFANGTAMAGVLKVPAQLGKEAKEKLRAEWESLYTGIDNAQRVAILDMGLDFQSIGMPLKDAQFIESMKFDKTEIATIFNIPMHMVNELGQATYSNIEQQSIDFANNTLSPIATQYEQEFSYKLLSLQEQKTKYIKFNFKALLKADSQARAAFYKEMVQMGVMSINEVRELEEMDIIENGDKHFISLNFTTLDIIENYQISKATNGTQPVNHASENAKVS